MQLFYIFYYFAVRNMHITRLMCMFLTAVMRSYGYEVIRFYGYNRITI